MKVLRILLLSIIFSTVAIGQSLQILDTAKTAIANKPIGSYVKDSNPIPIKGNITVTGGATAANQTNGTQTTMITGSPNNYAVWFSTAGTVKDSVSFGFTTREVTFINDGVSTDTLFVSTSALFPSTNTIKRVGGEGFTKQWATTKLYFKVATTPAASKKVRVEAN